MLFVVADGLWTNPLVLPAAAAWVVLTTVAWFGVRARRARTGRPAPSRWALVFALALGGLFAVTLTPSRIGLGLESDTLAPGWCLQDWPVGWPLRGFGLWAAEGERRWNVLITVPLGLAAAAWFWRRRCHAVARLAPVVALATPVGVELVQATVAPLGRLCQVSDVLDNASGVAVGLVAGSLVAAFARRPRGRANAGRGTRGSASVR